MPGALAEHRPHLVGRAGKHHRVRSVAHVARPDAQQVRRRLTACVADPGLVVGPYVLLADHVHQDPHGGSRRGRLDPAEIHRRGRLRLYAEHRPKEIHHGFG